MQWFVDQALSSAVDEALKRHGHIVHRLGELGLAEDARLGEIVAAARQKQWDIITGNDAVVQWIYDNDFWTQRSVVYLQVEGGDVEQDDAVDRLFTRYKRLTPSRLYTVTGTRVKVRQLPSYRPGVRSDDVPSE